MSFLNQCLDMKLDKDALEGIQRKIEGLFQEMTMKIDYKDWETQIGKTSGQFEEFHIELAHKSNIKDVCTLLDMKSNIDDVNKALGEIHGELDIKVQQTELQLALSEQA